MRVLIYSDVHGNLPAFEAMLKHVGSCDGYICLGDLVNYGPWSNECVDLASSLPNSVLLMGNHEEAFINGHYPGENKLVSQFFEKTFDSFSRFDTIKKYKTSHLFNNYVHIHTINNQYVYPDTTLTLDNNYVIGHSHHQFVYRSNDFTLYNAGSVGQNRGFINVANYLLSDADMKDFKLNQITFDVDLVIDKMKTEGYPADCIQYYKNKKRA